MSDCTEPTPVPEPVMESDPDDYPDDDELDDDDDWDEWQYASSSDDIAELLIDKLNEKTLTKTMWTNIVAALHEEFRHKFCEPVEVNEPATAR